ncbi:phage terminase large subunit [Parelusimicrobium proximum]|uniref:PBSX family phage terminase large subunit n=1 Tax=Parelusimicrobium proximum TaxID=3228953 RepID=UPI003D16F29D
MKVNRIPVSPLFKKLNKSKSKTVVSVGGARSGKSHAMAQLLIMRAQNMQGINIGITRKTMPALKMTAMRLVITLLKEYSLYSAANHNKMEHYYMLGSSRIQFFSLDNPEKIKSTEFNYIWLEEATEFTYGDYITLLTRLSAPSPELNQIFLTLNPSDSAGWINTKLRSAKDTEFIKSNYKNNPFLNEEYISTLLSLRELDEDAYQVFALGNWVKRKETVYDNYSFTDSLSSSCDDVIWGLDFGFNNPAALVKIQIKDGGAELEEKLYETRLTNTDLIKKLDKIISRKSEPVYADSAEPDRIEELRRAGFNVFAASKNVAQGIMLIKSKRLKITKKSVNLIKEIQNYSWKTDSAGNVLEEPVKFNDHALDALRYALYTYFNTSAAMPEVRFI